MVLTGTIRFSTATLTTSRFIPSRLDNIEDVEDYQRGGYHPISIGDTFDCGRFRVLHKLGFGGSSTLWLVRDQWEGSRVVTLKAMRADFSSKLPSEIPELVVPQRIGRSLDNFQTVDHHFVVRGPNGSHRFLIFALAGPSILAMTDCPGRVAGSRRLRADLARKVAKQTAIGLLDLHCAGVVHGGMYVSRLVSVCRQTIL